MKLTYSFLVGLAVFVAASELQAAEPQQKPDPIFGAIFKGMADGSVIAEGKTRLATKYAGFTKDTLRKGTDDQPNPNHNEITVDTLSFSLRHGVTKGMEIQIVAPFQNREFHSGPNEAENFAARDFTVKTRFALLSESLPKNIKIGAGIGVKIPSGDTGNTSQKSFETKTRTGTGSFDYIADVGLTGRTPHSRYDLYAAYTMTTEGRYGIQEGDTFWVNADYFHSVYPHVNLGLEASYDWQDNSEVNGAENPNSGHTTVWATPQIQVIPFKGWDLAAGAAIPVYDDINGQQLGNTTRYLLRLATVF